MEMCGCDNQDNDYSSSNDDDDDQDDDAEVSKDEFVHLILQVLRKMKESEEEFQRTYQAP